MNIKLTWLRWLTAALACGLTLAAFLGERLNNEHHATHARVVVQEQLEPIRSRLKDNLQSDMLLVRALLGIISIDPNLSQTTFDQAAHPLLIGNPRVRRFAWAPDMVVRVIHPLAGAEKTIGLDLSKASARAAAAERARLTRRIVLAGPQELAGGGIGLASRMPVFQRDADGEERFQGLLMVAIDIEALYRDSGVLAGDLPIEIAIRGTDAKGPQGEVFFGRAGVFDEAPVLMSIPLPEGSWQMAALPRGGWPAKADNAWLMRLALLLAALLLLGPFYAMARSMGALTDARNQAHLEKARLNATLESTPHVAVQWYDRNGRVLYWNHASEILYGWTAAEATGKTHDQLFPATGKTVDFHGMLAKIEASGEVVGPGDYSTHHRDGSLRMISATMFEIPGESSSIFACMAVDITERKRVEAKLKESEERRRFAIDGVGDGIWDWNMQTNEMLFSRCYMNMLGYEEAELPNHADTWVNSVHPDDWQRTQDSLGAYLAGKLSNYAIELRLRCKDGTYKWILCRGMIAARDGEGNPIRMTGIHSDISKRKQAEELLRASESMFRSLVEVLPLPVMVTLTAEQKPIVLNRRFIETFGYTLEDLPDIEHWRSLAFPDRDYRASPMGEWDRWKTDTFERQNATAIEVNVTCKDGSVRQIEFYATSTRDHVIAILHDISERKQAAAELARAKEAAEQSSQAKSAFLASMSHELRTPLNAVIGFAQMLDMGAPGPLTPTQKEAVGHIVSGGNHLLELINEVLDLALIEGGGLTLAIATIALDPVIEEVVALTQPIAQQRQITMKHACQTGLLVRADLARMRQILLNLLSNAVKYNREGGQISVIHETEGNLARIIVTDTGPGISQKRQAQLFEPFQRLGAENTAVEGTGIGLVICAKLAQAMGGAIGFDSVVGVGSRFWLELPCIRSDHLSDVAAAACVAATEIRRDDAFSGRVLYVEDNATNASLMESVFQQLPGTELRIARSAEEGLGLIGENPPDLVLTDISLPGMSGLALLKMIKADPRTAAIPVAAISASAMPQDVKGGLEAGFQAYFTKPIDVLELMTFIRKALRRNEQA